mgnify:CR=1 FL=1
MALIEEPTEHFNYSDPLYAQFENEIVDLQFLNSPYTDTIRLKQTTRIGDLLAYVGGIITSMLLVFRFVTKQYSRFSSDIRVYESLSTNTTGHSGDKHAVSLDH